MRSPPTPCNAQLHRATLEPMSLIEDILAVARDAEAGQHRIWVDPEVEAAANRILSAHANGGLPRAILGQAMQTLESRLVTSVREIAHELTGPQS